MADLAPAFERMIHNEGGFRLIDIAADRGGQTYAGIARNFHPQWPGWRYIDSHDLQNAELSKLVRDFYRNQFWQAMAGDDIKSQAVAETIFDFAVNAGAVTAVKLAQLVVGSTPDGQLGPLTLGKINEAAEEVFILKYALAKVARYAEICKRDRNQSKFLLGWINRTLQGLA